MLSGRGGKKNAVDVCQDWCQLVFIVFSFLVQLKPAHLP